MSAPAAKLDRALHDATAAELLMALKSLVARAESTPAERIKALQDAYETGRRLGELEGMEEMGELLTAQLDASIAKAKRS